MQIGPAPVQAERGAPSRDGQISASVADSVPYDMSDGLTTHLRSRVSVGLELRNPLGSKSARRGRQNFRGVGRNDAAETFRV
jgi:hypothetical protein